jgi:Excreted virulence factor EspC, type VII ESX diderm
MSEPLTPGGQGFGVVADQLRTLAGFFEDLEDTADGLASRVQGLSISGEHTGRCCREAGDALRSGLQTLQANLDEFGSRALDIRGALNGTARNYDNADASGAQSMTAIGGDLS